jgi:hypothetical protein
MLASDARRQKFTSVMVASDWEKYRAGGEVPIPEIMHPRVVSPGLEVYALRLPDFDDENEIHLVNPVKSSEAFIAALQIGMRLRQASEMVVEGPFLAELVKAVRVVAEAGDMSLRALLTAILGNGHNLDETALPLACAIAAEQEEVERLERCKPVETMLNGERWFTDGCACWIADGPQPSATEELLPSQRDKLKDWKMDFDSKFTAGNAGFIPDIDKRYYPLANGRTTYTAQENDHFCLVYDSGKLVAVIAGLQK